MCVCAGRISSSIPDAHTLGPVQDYGSFIVRGLIPASKCFLISPDVTHAHPRTSQRRHYRRVRGASCHTRLALRGWLRGQCAKANVYVRCHGSWFAFDLVGRAERVRVHRVWSLHAPQGGTDIDVRKVWNTLSSFQTWG